MLSRWNDRTKILYCISEGALFEVIDGTSNSIKARVMQVQFAAEQLHRCTNRRTHQALKQRHPQQRILLPFTTPYGAYASLVCMSVLCL
jgi:hypothetical protein